MRRILGSALLVVGALSVLLAGLVATGAVTALIDRIKFGPGLMFADVEILGGLAILLGAVGGVLLWLGSRLARAKGSSGGGGE